MNGNIHIIIVDYFKASRVVEAVHWIGEQNTKKIKIKTTIIDNSCCQKNLEILKSIASDTIEVIESPRNVGYVAAVNMAAKHGPDADAILLLNPDILLKDRDTLAGLYENLEDPTCYIVGPAQENDDGSIPRTVRGYPSLFALVSKRTILGKTRWGAKSVSKYLLDDFDTSRRQAVPWIQSSCVLIRKSYWEAVGGLNEKYYLFMADIEICKKAYECGGAVIYDPKYTVLADGRRCSEGGPLTLIKSRPLRIHLVDALKYYAK